MLFDPVPVDLEEQRIIIGSSAQRLPQWSFEGKFRELSLDNVRETRRVVV
jgi:hypothetical protein